MKPEISTMRRGPTKQRVTFFIDEQTKLVVLRGESGDFISTWKVDDVALQHLLKDGARGGG